MDAKGLAIDFPAMSGADPCIGSNIDGYWRSGFIFAPAAKPRPPEMAAPKSVSISPKRLEVTII